MLKGLLAAGLLATLLWSAGAEKPDLPAYIFTSASRYDARGHDRFPGGASLVLVNAGTRRKIAPDFAASADGVVSYDASHILFAGKRTAASHWQIWEVPVAGGAPRAITPEGYDSIRPLYLPDVRVAYTHVWMDGSDVEVAPLQGGKPLRLTYGADRYLTNDVLRDGRILIEASGELFTVYPDGTGIESLRCDHGPKRFDGRQIAAGDVVFSVGARLARFLSARAEQVDIAQPEFESAGPIAEIAAGQWILSLRRKPSSPYGLFQWSQATGRLLELETGRDNALEPAILRPHTPPKEFPSALVPSRLTGNLLCLNARDGKQPLDGEVRSVRMYTRDALGAPALLGQAPVERDGSFYVEVPADKPLRIELLNAAGTSVRAEHGWFWMRPSEQRICVGCHTGPEQSPENKVPDVLLRTTKPEKLLGVKP